jgi:hypothetical protein
MQNSYLIQDLKTPRHIGTQLQCILDLEATGHPDGKWACPDGMLKTRGTVSLTRAVQTEVVAIRTNLGQHRFLHSFGVVRLDGVLDASSDELLGFLHMHHVSGRSMSPSGWDLFQFQFCTWNSILFTNISQYLKLTRSL